MSANAEPKTPNPAIDLATNPPYANFTGPVPRNILLDLAIADPCEDIRMAYQMGKGRTWRGSGETYSTRHAFISGYEDQDPVRDED